MSATIPPLQDQTVPYDLDAGWHWHDTTLIVFERENAGRSEYAVGAVDLYANANTGDLGGSYLELATFEDIDRAAHVYRARVYRTQPGWLSPDNAQKYSAAF